MECLEAVAAWKEAQVHVALSAVQKRVAELAELASVVFFAVLWPVVHAIIPHVLGVPPSSSPRGC